MVRTTSAPAAASAGESNASAPVSVSARAFAGSRFHIRTGTSARRSDRTIPAPIVPVPRTVTTGVAMRPVCGGRPVGTIRDPGADVSMPCAT
jgi:hypothetical protein